MSLARLKDICIDASDQDRMAGFWQLAPHAARTRHETHPEFWWLTPGVEDSTIVWINGVPESPPPSAS
ncbi:hypothetical protein J2S43_003812 [Catenuloplanes nepalensis]|uniref:Uncharacterized protein n=1 Tax=Catenuloplanes nepalensis TaxID=587533 RepID=A0ABT9MV90_9ACTN|nr:hypothetical protein [Catenuloplanes nepalensis]MDP9795300.1 hypothetical protein [Catenuloplanes nepalensis]